MALHPASPPFTVPTTATPALVVTSEDLDAALRRAPRGSAPGPSGWTYEHVRSAVADDDDAFAALLAYVNLVLAGGLPAVPHALDSRLIALQKPNGGVRPIAIGEVLLRLVGLCALRDCQAVGAALTPLQMGVGVPGGSAAVAHAVRAGAVAAPADVTVALDLRNAFNSVSRGAVLAAVADRAPALLPFAAWAYRAPARLFVQGSADVLLSRAGVRQGDPCGPLFFALAVQGPLEDVARAFPAVRIVAYADDVTLQGPPDAVAAAFRALVRHFAQLGLDARLGKCAAWSFAGPAALAVARALAIRHAPEGLVVQGAAIGTPAFERAHVADQVDCLEHLLGELDAVPLSAQSRFLVLRGSLRTRLEHLARCMPEASVGDGLLRFHATILGVVCAMFAPRSGPGLQADMPAHARAQLCLPLRCAGFGIVQPSSEASHAAYLSAAALAFRALAGGPAAFSPFAGPSAQAMGACLASVRAVTPALCPSADAGGDPLPAVSPSLQHAFNRVAADRAYQALRDRFPPSGGADSKRHLLRLDSAAFRCGGLFLDTLPTRPRLYIPSGAFISKAQHRLGLPVAVDTWVEPVLARTGQTAGLSAPAAAGDLHAAWDGGDVVVDFVVPHPCADTYALRGAGPGGARPAVELAEQAKRRKYGDPASHPYAFVPFAIDTYGRLGPAAMAYLGRMADRVADRAATGRARARAAFMESVLRDLSASLARSIGLTYHASLKLRARVAGRDFRPGLTAPSTAPVDG